MKITRINSDKNLDMSVNYLDIEINGKRYRLTESIDGKLNIQHLAGDSIAVHPCVRNVIEIEAN